MLSFLLCAVVGAVIFAVLADIYENDENENEQPNDRERIAFIVAKWSC